jgi:hypothetical protein
VRACVCVCVCVPLNVLKNVQWWVLMNTVFGRQVLSRAGSFYTIRSIIRFLRMTVLHVVHVTRRRQQLTLAAYKTRRTRMIPSFTNVLDNFLLCIQSVSSLCHHYARFIALTLLCNDFCLRHCN